MGRGNLINSSVGAGAYARRRLAADIRAARSRYRAYAPCRSGMCRARAGSARGREVDDDHERVSEVPPDLDPDRRSFVRTLRVVSPSGDRTDGLSPDQVAAAVQTGVEELLTEPLPTPAACVPRTVGRKMSNYS